MHRLLFLTLLFTGTCFASALDSLNPDDLPRDPIPNPAGGYVYNIRHLNRSWREKKPDALLARQLQQEEDICFEAKFDSFSGKTLKLFGQEGKVICLDPRLVETVRKLNRAENIWVCGTLRAAKEGQGVELLLEQVFRLPEDLERKKSKIAMLEKRKGSDGKLDAEGLFEIGREIGALLEEKLLNFNQHDDFLTLQKRAFGSALAIKESQLDPNDADGLYALAEKWDELMHKKQKRNDLILRVLKLDPGHPKAGKVASEEMDMVLYDGAWMSRADRDQILAEIKAKKELLDASQRQALEAQARQREEAVRERAVRLLKHQSAIRAAGNDFKRLEQVLRDLGTAIQKSPDPQFGRKAVDLLTHIADPAAIYPGLDLAVQSEFAEVRGDAFEALVWRGTENALKTLSHALRVEKDPPTVKSVVQALVGRADRPAMTTLIECLQSENSGVVAEVVEGLKTIQHSNLAGKEAWIKWWESNKDRQDLIPATP